MADDRELDAILDEALASYANVEPDPWLRARMNALTAEMPRHRARSWLLGTAAACVTTLTFVLLLYPRAHSPLSQPAAPSAIATAPESTAPVNAVSGRTVHPNVVGVVRRKHSGEHSPPRRNAIFPSPTPLTAEESILLKFATEHPEQARQVLMMHATEPIESASIKIEPIHIAALSEIRETQHAQGK